MESLQRVNQEQRLAEWGRRVEACRSSGLPVGQWCEEHGIAVSTYFAWQKRVFQALKEVQELTLPRPSCKREHLEFTCKVVLRIRPMGIIHLP